MKRQKWLGLAFLLSCMLAACSQEEPEAEVPNQQEEVKENLAETKEVQVSASSSEQTTESEPNLHDALPIPKSFVESAEYEGTGMFAGKKFTNQKEITDVLDKFPVLTENSSEQEITEAKQYLLSLFKEDLSMVDVPIDQWESMQFKDPNEESESIQLKENYNVVILLDSSGSMANWENNKTRMQLAKESIQLFVENLPEQANVSLRVYGHVGTGNDEDKAKSCSKVDEVYPLGKYNNSKFSEALNKFEPAGWTPTGLAIKQVEEDLKKFNGEENTNIIYIVSDGVETCDTNPVGAIKSLAESNIQPVVNIIGYHVDNDGLAQLKEMAKVSNGSYVNAVSQEQLNAEFQQTVDMAKIWSDWHDNAQGTLNQLFDTIQLQLNNWYDQQQILKNREYDNLLVAVNYLNKKGIIDMKVFLEFDDSYREYFLIVDDETREIFLELDGLNRESFLDNWDSINDRLLENVN
ncbi:vWA domain-containing protein [Lysinibacillus telephonicus]|uniref:VWA domain-containing protein n=1 Tax=Lysinibacillus telephonicus TaxID=1714840 RepID=A0A431UPH8_9BACI|nr:VWA domain-containing protein [Lysinibacillus telephonicus]RTQ91339.1 VWA domain-containing protein [Lysinibacillus telephonicus]